MNRRDPVIESLTMLPKVAPDAERAARTLARCRSAMAKGSDSGRVLEPSLAAVGAAYAIQLVRIAVVVVRSS